MQGILSNRVVRNDAVFSHWIEGSECFWCRREAQKGKIFRLVDAGAATNTPAFDHQGQPIKTGTN